MFFKDIAKCKARLCNVKVAISKTQFLKSPLLKLQSQTNELLQCPGHVI
jgi:hypothetical protein